VLTAWDVGIFGIFCDACARHRRAAEILDWEGVVVGDRINPAFTVWRTTALLVIKSGGRFGLSPADRQTLGLRAQSPTSDLLSS
jgi:phage terminase small subunit